MYKYRNNSTMFTSKPIPFVISIDIHIGDCTAKMIQNKQLNKIVNTKRIGKASGLNFFLYILMIWNRGDIKYSIEKPLPIHSKILWNISTGSFCKDIF